MNIYFIIIVGVIVFNYLLSFLVRTLNIRALDPKLPEKSSGAPCRRPSLSHQRVQRQDEIRP